MAEPDIDLKGKTVLISGASRGIGRGIALAAASKGATVICVGRTLERDGNRGSLRETAELIESSGGRAFPFACDVSKPEEIYDLFTNIDRDLDGIDILVMNQLVYCLFIGIPRCMVITLF